MKKKFLKLCMPVLMLLLIVLGISSRKKDIIVEENFPGDEIIIKKSRFKDSMWHTDKYSYKYKLHLTGKLPKADEDIIFVVLSNNENITFDDISKTIFDRKKDFNEEDFILSEIKKIRV